MLQWCITTIIIIIVIRVIATKMRNMPFCAEFKNKGKSIIRKNLLTQWELELTQLIIILESKKL